MRKVVRARSARLPFVPYAVVPLVGLGIIFLLAFWPFARNSIEVATEQAATKALAAVGADWAEVRISGQRVVLQGTPPSREAARQAMEAVREAKASTPFGPARPATHVTGDFLWTDISDGSGNNGNAWSFRLADGVLTLDGDMPDRETRDQILNAARATIEAPRIISVQDSLIITRRAVQPGFNTIALRGIDTVTRCDRGVAGFSANRFSLSCELPGAEAADVREMAIAPLPFGDVGAVDILATEAVETCEASLAEILDFARIEFGSSSAVIGNSSAGLLDSVAEAVRACPGNLRIEGHTDSTGLPDTNSALSQARAEAVRNALIARGVPPTRLVATGFGATRPVATNATADGRAQNRRIEIKVIRASE